MAWFHKTLNEAQVEAEKQFDKPIEQQNWNKVLGILQEHVDIEKHEEGGLSDASFHINKYSTELFQLHGFISEVIKGRRKGVIGGDQTTMKQKFREAISSAKKFEAILIRLINEGDKLK